MCQTRTYTFLVQCIYTGCVKKKSGTADFQYPAIYKSVIILSSLNKASSQKRRIPRSLNLVE